MCTVYGISDERSSAQLTGEELEKLYNEIDRNAPPGYIEQLLAPGFVPTDPFKERHYSIVITMRRRGLL